MICLACDTGTFDTLDDELLSEDVYDEQRSYYQKSAGVQYRIAVKGTGRDREIDRFRDRDDVLH